MRYYYYIERSEEEHIKMLQDAFLDHPDKFTIITGVYEATTKTETEEGTILDQKKDLIPLVIEDIDSGFKELKAYILEANEIILPTIIKNALEQNPNVYKFTLEQLKTYINAN